MTGARDSEAGAALYTRAFLRIYDPIVHGFNLPVLWRCRSIRIQRLYDEFAAGNHLDVGVGTGLYLDRCRWGTAPSRLVLMDLNTNSLRHAAARVRRFAPETRVADVLQPLEPEPAPFDSVGLANLLHCLPGPMERKARAFDHVRAAMNPGAVVFGSTLMGRGLRASWPARVAMRRLNRRGIFSNEVDDVPSLRAVLAERFTDVRLEVVGLMALFSARC